jgi:hypothetical protein
MSNSNRQGQRREQCVEPSAGVGGIVSRERWHGEERAFEHHRTGASLSHPCVMDAPSRQRAVSGPGAGARGA